MFVSAALIERPWNIITFALDLYLPNVFFWKVRGENYLRKSGINYAIVRPTHIVGDQKTNTLTKFTVDQGDRILGEINRYTLGHLVF